MSALLIALPAAAAVGLAAWRVALARRRAAAWRAARDRAEKTALKAARRSAAAAKAPAARSDIDAARATARARADGVIAAEAARREAERRAAAAAAARVATPPPPHMSAPERAAPPPATNRQSPKTAAETLIMAVDDSKMVRVKASRLLAAHGFQVVTAIDGLDALRQVEARIPDLVITDVEMPGMDGFGLANALRGDPRTRHIPLVMITSAEDRHRADAQRAGVGLMMCKPYDEAALIAHIRGFSFFADTERTASAAWA